MLRLFELKTARGLFRMLPENILAVEKMNSRARTDGTTGGVWGVRIHLTTAIEGKTYFDTSLPDEAQQSALFEHVSEMMDSLAEEGGEDVAS